METSYLKTLELDKIIARAAEGCVCKESREKLLAIEPQCDPDEVRYALEQTDAIKMCIRDSLRSAPNRWRLCNNMSFLR